METDFKITAPVLDMNVIQKAAQDAAMKAALEEVKDYYLGYNSPYRKQLKEYMAKNAPSTRLELPEFSELLSKSLTAEIENFVNKKCVESFAQELRKGFTHLKEESDGTILLTNLAEDMMHKVDLDKALEAEYLAKGKAYKQQLDADYKISMKKANRLPSIKESAKEALSLLNANRFFKPKGVESILAKIIQKCEG